MSEAERASLQEHIDAVYERFLDAVIEGRGQQAGLSREALREIAEGRVWTGAQAKERKLVDHIGGVLETLEAAREQAGLPKDEPIAIEVLTGTEDDLPRLIGLAQALAPGHDAQAEGLARAVRLLLGDPGDAAFALDHAGRPLAVAPTRIRVR